MILIAFLIIYVLIRYGKKEKEDNQKWKISIILYLYLI
jgi:hypothetical protein